MLNAEKQPANGLGAMRRYPAALAGLAAALMACAAMASRSIAADRRISEADARRMAEAARSATGFPVAMNEFVLREMNRLIGTPEGRDRMRAALERMQARRPLLERKLAQYGAPEELAAIPIVESGYQNLPQRPRGPRGAGLWQFIPSTARKFGLRVDAAEDERLDVEAETDAAMRYLMSNYLTFRDWPLAVLAYNVGEDAVVKSIAEVGSRDAWTLIRRGFENDKGYLASVMASIIVMRSPESTK